MADIRCSHCGKNNPDFLDVCQFCQSPLKSESMLHIGQRPTKKDTGELEGVLPDWLKNARQQARDSAEEDAAYAASQPKPKKDEPVDLLAGLFQSESSEEEDVPDWLTSINQNIGGKPAAPTAPAQPEAESEFFAQFNKSDIGSKSEPPRESLSTPQSEPMQPSQDFGQRDELSDWFAQASERPEDPFAPDREPSQASTDWGIGDPLSSRAEESSVPKEAEDLSWLHNLESASKKTDELKAPKSTPNWEQDFGTPSQSSDQDDLSWLNNLGALPGTEQSPAQPAQPSQPQDDLSWLDSLGGTSSPATSESPQEDLDWLNKLGGTPFQQPPAQPAKPQEDLSWLDSFKQTEEPSQPAPQASSREDLSWLNTLGATTPESPSVEPSRPQEDLSWLNSFSETPVSEPPAPAQPASQEDMGWLDNLGGTPLEAAPSQPEKPQQDLSWLSSFGGTAEPQPPASTPSSTSSDMDWLNTLGSTPVQEPAASQPPAQEDMGWLNSLQSGEPDPLASAPFAQPTDEEDAADVPHISPFMPRKTAPLNEGSQEEMPDWLKSATEGPSMPMGVSGLEQFREDYKIPTGPEDPFSWKSFTQEEKPAEEQPPLSSFFPAQDQAEPASVDPGMFSTGSSSSVPSAEEVNSLFSIEMPDWLSQAEPAKQEDTAQPIGVHDEGGEALAPVDLPSWVQAMRPMDAVISEAAPSIDDQPTEREGPLAGLKGLIPAMPVGSARRPKPISLKLQASDEQQSSAAILEQLLAGETSPRPVLSAPVYAPQRTLRWALAALVMIVLGGMIALRPQLFPPSAALTVESSEIAARLQGIPASGEVLVVIDYEAALAGEMEAVSAPMLEQMALLRHPRLSFVSTSPNGPALVERLMSNPIIKGTTDGLGGYVANQDYYNLGFLPGAESGVLSFIESPKTAVPSATVDVFSGYSAVVILTDHADSARIWIEQLQTVKQRDGALALQPLLVASSAQAGPMLQPYVASKQINGLISGLADASRFEYQNTSRPGIALSYLDAFGAGLLLAVALIVLGSLWSVIAGFRARRAETAEG